MCLLLFCQRLLQLLHGTSRICYALQGTCMLNQTQMLWPTHALVLHTMLQTHAHRQSR